MSLLALVLISAPALGATGFELLEGGDAAGARAWFEAELDAKPEDLALWEALAWSCLQLEDVPCAVRAADQRAALRPGDEWTPRHQLIAWQELDRREQALAAHAAWVEAHPQDTRSCAEHGAMLSWTEGRLKEAIAHYELCLARFPGEEEATAGLAQAREWREAHTPPAEPDPARSQVEVVELWGTEAGGFSRQSLRVLGGTPLGPRTHLRLDAGWTWFYDDESATHRASLGLRLDQELPAHLDLRGDYVGHLLTTSSPAHQAELLLSFQPEGVPLHLSAGARQRPLTELPREAQDQGILFGIGAGGMPVSRLADGFQTREASLSVATMPWERLRLYGAGTAGKLSDGNSNRTVSASAMLMALHLGAFQVWAGYNLWLTDYDHASLDYWAPSAFAVHQPTLEGRLDHGRDLTLSAEVGLPVNPDAAGLHTAGRLDSRLTEALDLGAGFLVSTSAGYRITALTLHLGGML